MRIGTFNLESLGNTHQKGASFEDRAAVHHGRPEMLDHILASRALFAHFVDVEIHNEMLEDELVAYSRISHPPESLHAPVIAICDFV